MKNTKLTTLTKTVRGALETLVGRGAKSDAVRGALPSAREMEAIALAEIETAQQEQAEARRAFDTARGLAAFEREKSATFELEAARDAIARLEAEERDALDREEDERKRQALDAARQKLEAGEKYLRKHWGEYGRGLRLMLRTVAEGDLLAKQVNENLPAGAEPLKTLEERLLRSYLAREDIESIEVELWVHAASGSLVPDDRQASVIDNGAGTGELPATDGRDSPRQVLKRRFRRTTYLPAASGSLYDGFARTLNVPGLAYEPPLFTPAPSDDPNAVLEHIEHLEAYEREFSSQRKPRTELVPIEAELPAAAE